MSIALDNIAWEIDPLNGSSSHGGGFVAGSSGTDKSYGVGQTSVLRTDLVCNSIGSPSAPTVNASGSGGTVAAGTYSVVVTYTGGGGETLPSSSSPVTVSSGQDIVVTSPIAATGADHFKVYISAVGTTTPLYLQNGPSGTALGGPFTLSSAVNATTANPPGSDSSGILLTSVAHPFGSTDAGNLVQVTAGTGWTLGFYAVMSVTGTTAVLDRSPAAAGTTGGTGTLGGALANPLNLPSLPGSNKVFIKGNAVAPMASSWTISASAIDGFATPPTLIQGYGTTREDGGKATLQATASNVTLINSTGNGTEIASLILDCNSQTNSTGYATAQFSSMRNCKVTNFSSYGALVASNNLVFASEFTGGMSGSQAINMNAGASAILNNVHDNAGVGIYSAGGTTIAFNVVSTCTGATTDGIQPGAQALVLFNDIRNCGRYGINSGISQNYAFAWLGNVLAGNALGGMVGSSSPGLSANSASDGNAFYNNGPGGTVSRLNMDDGTATSVNAINAVAPYTDTHDQSLTGDPWVNAAGGNYALNNTSGAGAPCRAAFNPNKLPGLAGTTNYRDLGTFQHQDSGGGSAPPRINSILID